jgi:hypothetical protein
MRAEEKKKVITTVLENSAPFSKVQKGTIFPQINPSKSIEKSAALVKETTFFCELQ